MLVNSLIILVLPELAAPKIETIFLNIFNLDFYYFWILIPFLNTLKILLNPIL